jgi:hypothetical protein
MATCTAGDHIDHAAEDAAAKLMQLRNDALDRLARDESDAAARVDREAAAREREVADKLAAARAEIDRLLDQAATRIPVVVLPEVDAAEATRGPTASDLAAQVRAAQTCVGAPWPAVATAAYSDLGRWRERDAADVQRARDAVKRTVDAAHTAAAHQLDDLIGAAGAATAGLERSSDAIHQMAARLRDELKQLGDGDAVRTRFKNLAHDGFAELRKAADAAIAAIDQVAGQARAAVEAARIDAIVRVDAAATDWLAAARAAGALAPVNLQRDAPSFVNLRAALRDSSDAWPEVMRCVCQSIEAIPPASAAGGALEQLTDAMCAGAIAMSAVSDAPAKLAQLRRMRAQPPPIDTGFDPQRAQTPPELAALRRKAASYEAWTQQQHVSDQIVLRCVTTPASRGGGPRGNCSHGYHTMANAGYTTGSLLAARAYEYGVLSAAGDPEAPRALAALEDTLLGMHHVMTIAGLPRCEGHPTATSCGTITAFATRDGKPITADATIAPVPGLPVRGFASVTSAVLANDDILTSHSPQAYELNGRLEGLPGTRFRFEERQSGDDTYVTLLALSAAYDVLKKTGAAPALRARIVEDAEAFGRYFVANGLAIRTLRGDATWAGGDIRQSGGRISVVPLDPLMFFQDLAWLRTILYLSQDFRGNRGSVVEVDRAYSRLTAAFGPGRVLTPGLRALATLVASPALKALREPVQYFHQAFTGDYWVISAYLLGRYESDPALAALYRDVMARVVWPLVDYIDAPMHLYALLYTIADPARFASVAGMSRDDAMARGAALLRQYRATPSPFGNPAPSTQSPAQVGFYYTDFTHRADLRDPLFDRLAQAWRSLPQQAPRTWKRIVAVGGGDNPFHGNRGGAWQLGEGLVPTDNHVPYSLVGGEWYDDGIGLFGNDHGTATVEAIAQVEYLFSYWFGRYHGSLGGG